MKAELTIALPGKVNPLYDRVPQRSFRAVLRVFLLLLQGILNGAGVASRAVSGGRAVVSTTIEYATAYAQALVTVAAPANSATVTLNGQALTGSQYRASGTVTFASCANNDTITVNGVIFTAKTSPAGAYQFTRGVSDTADAAAFIAKLNAATLATNDAAATGVVGLIEGSSAVAVATVYAIAEGTAGNALTLASSSNTTLAVSGAVLANGAAAANNGFDRIGGNARTARSIVKNLGLSSTAILSDHVLGACRNVIVTIASALAGDWIQVGSTKLFATKDATDASAGGARTATVRDEMWSLSDSDTHAAVSFCNCVNTHPHLRDRYYASNASGVVTIQERPPEATAAPAIVTSNGTRLAVTGSATNFADSAIVLFQGKRPGVQGNICTIATSSGTTLAITGALSRLAGGTSTTVAL